MRVLDGVALFLVSFCRVFFGLGVNFCFWVSEGKFEHFQEVINVNLLGLVKCTQKALQLMKAGGVEDGHIININRYV